MDISTNNPEDNKYYRIRDGKRKIIFEMAASVFFLTLGASTIIDGIMHANNYALGVGVLFIITGFLLLHYTNKDADEKITNYVQSLD